MAWLGLPGGFELGMVPLGAVLFGTILLSGLKTTDLELVTIMP